MGQEVFNWFENASLEIPYITSVHVYLSITNHMKVKVLVSQSCLTLCDPMDCSPSNSSVHMNPVQFLWNWNWKKSYN